MRFPAKKNAGCPKAPRDFPPRKDGILHPPLGCLGTSLLHPQSLYRWTDGRKDGRAGGSTLTSQPKFLTSIGYQICLPIVLPSAAFSRKGAPLKTVLFKYSTQGNTFLAFNSRRCRLSLFQECSTVLQCKGFDSNFKKIYVIQIGMCRGICGTMDAYVVVLVNK